MGRYSSSEISPISDEDFLILSTFVRSARVRCEQGFLREELKNA